MSKDYNKVPVKNNMNIEADNNEETVEAKEKKNLKRVVDVQPKKVERGLMNRLVTGILGPEGLPSIGTYVNEEIIKPAVKNIIVDAVTSGINKLIYGDSQPRTGGGRTGYSPHRTTYSNAQRPTTNYASRYSNNQPEPRDRIVARSPKYGVEEYIIEDRFDASHVLTSLTENADKYDSVSIADYYDLIGVPSQFTDNSYGWTIDSIVNATIVPVRGGYIIKFPPVEVI